MCIYKINTLIRRIGGLAKAFSVRICWIQEQSAIKSIGSGNPLVRWCVIDLQGSNPGNGPAVAAGGGLFGA